MSKEYYQKNKHKWKVYYQKNYEELCELTKNFFDKLQDYSETDIPEDAWGMLYRMYDIANDKYPRLGG